MSTEKKVYTKPEIDEIARLDRFVNDQFNAKNNDGKKLTFTTGNFIYFEKNS